MMDYFPSYESLSEDANSFYDTLKEAILAVWEEMNIGVLATDAAAVTAKFRFSFTDTNNEMMNLQCLWTAFYVRIKENRKIRMGREAFVVLEDEAEQDGLK